MTSRRTAKAAEAIRETVSTTVLFGLKDPRIKGVTVLSVEAAGDLRSCKVYVSIMGTPKQQSLAMHGLRAARGFLQAKLADRLQTRNTPVIEFVLDQGVKRSIEASRLLYESGTDFSVPVDTGEPKAEAKAAHAQLDDAQLDDESLEEGEFEDDEFDELDEDEDDFEDEEGDEESEESLSAEPPKNDQAGGRPE